MIANPFKKHKLLGRGGFGKVYACKLGTDDSYAMKIVELTDNELPEALKELSLMTFIHHDNLMKLEYSYMENSKLVMIMKKMDYSGDRLIYSNYLDDHVQLLSFLVQVARGVRFLHRHNIIHRDLKPQNTLANLKNIGPVRVLDEVKVADFGASKLLTGTRHAHTRVCTPLYCAPELLLGAYDSKVDSFSFGIMVGEAACKSLPKLNHQGHIKMTREEFKNKNREFLYELYYACTQSNPQKRPTFQKIVSDLEVLLVTNYMRKNLA